VDKASGKSQSVRVEAQTSLSKDEIERLKQEATTNAESDRKKKDLIEAKNRGETLVYSSEKALKDGGDKISADIKKEIEEKITSLRSALSSEDLEKIETTISELSSSLQKIGEAMYNKENGDKSSDENGKEEGDTGTVSS
jgi:molecular chaperone DnaK